MKLAIYLSTHMAFCSRETEVNTGPAAFDVSAFSPLRLDLHGLSIMNSLNIFVDVKYLLYKLKTQIRREKTYCLAWSKSKS